MQVQSVPGLLTVFFSERPVQTTPAPRACDTDAYGAWCRGAARARAYIRRASQFEAWFPSLAHADADVERTVTPPPRRSRRSPTDEDRPRRSRALREALRGQGGTVAELARASPATRRLSALDRPGPAQVAAAGPRAAGREREYELLLEMILEGYRLHYDEPLVVRPEDADLALLLGDQLYALGLVAPGRAR